MSGDGHPQTDKPIKAGLKCRCPRCGEGRLFSSYLKVADRCSVCGLDFSKSDSGDGPAIFIMFIVGFIVVFGGLIVEVKYQPPYWLHAVIWGSVTIGLSLALLPPLKGMMVALQFHHKAEEAKLDHDSDD